MSLETPKPSVEVEGELVERLGRLKTAYTAATTGYARPENVYCLPVRHPPDAVDVLADHYLDLKQKYLSLARIKIALGQAETFAERKEAAQSVTEWVGGLTEGQRAVLAEQVIVSTKNTMGYNCALCNRPLKAEGKLLPCEHVLHDSCLRAVVPQAPNIAGSDPRCPACRRHLAVAALLWDPSQRPLQRCKDVFLDDGTPLDPPPGPSTGPPPSIPCNNPESLARRWRPVFRRHFNILSPTLTGSLDLSILTAILTGATEIDLGALEKDCSQQYALLWHFFADGGLGYKVTDNMTLRDRLSIVDDINAVLVHLHPKLRVVLVLEFLPSLPAAKQPWLRQTSNSCLVCLDEFADTAYVTALPCDHVLHTSCLTDWFEQSATTNCPMCRRDFAVPAAIAAMSDSHDAYRKAEAVWKTNGWQY